MQPRHMSRSTSVARRRNVTRNRLYIEDNHDYLTQREEGRPRNGWVWRWFTLRFWPSDPSHPERGRLFAGEEAGESKDPCRRSIRPGLAWVRLWRRAAKRSGV